MKLQTALPALIAAALGALLLTQVTLPAGTATTKIVTDGAYSLLAKMKNAEEEEE